MGKSRCRVRRIDIAHHGLGKFDLPRRAAVQARFALAAEDEPPITKGKAITEELDHTED
jgi:hypothetical protein